LALSPLINEEQLGGLKLEGIYHHVTIYNLKDYEIDGMRKIKGVPRDGVETVPGIFSFTRFQRFRTAIRTGKSGCPIEYQTQRQLRRKYNKGIMFPDGRVRPFSY